MFRGKTHYRYPFSIVSSLSAWVPIDLRGAVLRALHACVNQREEEAAYALLSEAKGMEERHLVKAGQARRMVSDG